MQLKGWKLNKFHQTFLRWFFFYLSALEFFSFGGLVGLYVALLQGSGCTVSCPIKIHWSYTQTDDESCSQLGIGCEGNLSTCLQAEHHCRCWLKVRSWGGLKRLWLKLGKALDFYSGAKWPYLDLEKRNSCRNSVLVRIGKQTEPVTIVFDVPDGWAGQPEYLYSWGTTEWRW